VDKIHGLDPVVIEGILFMDIRHFPIDVKIPLRMALCSLMALMLAACGAPECTNSTTTARSDTPVDPAAPNVLLISIDTLRADHLGCYGYEAIETPTIDGLAAAGTLFEQAYSAAPFTAPSHASILTGAYPFSHGLRDNGSYVLAPEHLTLAEILASRGYRTAAFISSFVLSKKFGLAQGFQTYDDDLKGGAEVDQFGRTATGGATQSRSWMGHEYDSFERSADIANESLLPWLDAHASEPFFVWLHYYDPHLKYNPPEPFKSNYSDRLYDGEIAFVDQELGAILRRLETLGELDQTLVVLVADHGESFGDREHSHGRTLYDPLIRVPLIIVPPKFADTQPQRISGQVRTIDIAPTILDLLGLPASPTMEGETLAEQVRTGEELATDLLAYSETHHLERPYRGGIIRSLRTPEWKYMTLEQRSLEQLYSLAADPDERRNVLTDEPAARAEMSQRMRETIGSDGSRPDGSGEVEMDPETIEKLRALGYIEE
jgi:arylsulfatase A-like enzyme